MRTWTLSVAAGGIMVAAALASAQPPGDGPRPRPAAADDLATRMLAFDQNKDGKLTRAEVTDERLHGLFDRADANHDDTVTKAELNALAAREQGDLRGGPPGGGFGPRGGGPRGGGPGGPPALGLVLPSFVQERLELSAEQKSQVAELQKDVDARLAKILTADQQKTFQEMRDRGPGRFGPPPGRGGRPGGPGGRPDGPPPGRPL